MRAGLVVALRAEARAMLGRGGWQKGEAHGRGPAGGGGGGAVYPLREIHAASGRGLLASLSGMGAERAQGAAGMLIERGAGSLMSAGISGALSPGLRAGGVILAEGVIVDEGGALRSVNEGVLEFAAAALEKRGMAFSRGTVLSTGRAVLGSRAKAALFRKTGALAVDMESGGVALAAAKAGLPLFVLRTVCDTAAEGISEDLYACLDEEGGLRPGQVLGGCLRRPSMMGEMMRLRRSFGLALVSLGRAWRALVEEGLLVAMAGGGDGR